MPFSLAHSPVSSGVRAMWQAHQGRCDSWHLLFDKLAFQPAAAISNRRESPKLNALLKIRESYDRAKQEMSNAVEGKKRFLVELAEQHGERFQSVSLVNCTRLIVQLGRANVLENVGLCCERTTGLLLIPGSAVKGVLSTWACWEGNGDEIYSPNDRGKIKLEQSRSNFNGAAKRIFGDNSETGSTDAGELVFLGGFPDQPPVLGLDIVTPHTNAAGGDQDPVPSPFLAIEPGTTWCFAFIAKPRDNQECNILLETTRRWITEALEQAGIGAKTAGGYGRFLSIKNWNEATLDAAVKAQNDANVARLTEMRAGYIGDYNEKIFANAILSRLGKPGEYQLLEKEILKLQGSPENAHWISKLTKELRANKAARKRLKDKNWFPKEWLPQ